MNSRREPIDVAATRELQRLGSDRGARRLAGGGSLTRLRAGVFVDTAEWDDSASDERYTARIRAVVGTRRSSDVLSHHSAARVWGIPVVNGWPAAVHITESPGTRRRSGRGVIVHRRELGDGEVARVGELLVTSRLRTVVDLARDAAFVDAVAAADFVLDRRHPLLRHQALMDAVDVIGPRGRVRAQRVCEFATDLSMSVLESFGRVIIHEAGFPRPVLQHEVVVRSGRRRLLDYWWEDHSAGAEADGRSKYEENPLDAILAEKHREAELADVRVRFTRFGWIDCVHRERLIVRLTALGIPRRGLPVEPPQ